MYYIYRADNYCEQCGDNIIEEFRTKGDAGRLDSNDSGDCPISSYDFDSDHQMYCAECECRIQTYLTTDGKWQLIKDLADQISLNGRVQHHTLENIKEHGIEMEDVLEHFYYAAVIREMNGVLNK